MSRLIRFGMLALCLAACEPARSEPCPPAPGSLCPGSRGGLCPTCRCPDDYVPKPCPWICLAPIQGCRDDYCPKAFPSICPPAIRWLCDDYCPKPCPSLCFPWTFHESYRCPPPQGCDVDPRKQSWGIVTPPAK
jgi:hypothetical protein